MNGARAVVRFVPLPARLAAVLLAAVPAIAAIPVAAQTASAPDSAAGAAFAARLAAALTAGPIAWDRLWEPQARDAGTRVLDARSHALFDWFDVEVAPERMRTLDDGRVVADVVVRGTATWRPDAWGVATSFWTQQTDERFASNRVVRRERWTLASGGGKAVRRGMLSPLQVTEARVDVGVYPGQDALLVDATYSVRSLADGVRDVRFLLDRRAQIYDLRVNGILVEYVRGNELGSLGLEGFSPELESSLQLPRALDRGEEALIRFRLRSPLVHMRGPGYATSLPIQDGPFRERVWLPVFGPTGDPARDESGLELSFAWPDDAYATLALAANGPVKASSNSPDNRLEERRVSVSLRGNVADVDFALLDAGTALADLPGGVADADGGDVIRFTRPTPGAQLRTRASLVQPLLDASTASSQDLSAELEDLVPLDQDFLDELFDDSSQDAERGADDRQAG